MNSATSDGDLPDLPYAGTSGWSGSDTSRDRADRRDHDGSTESLQRRMLVLVAQTGVRGLTVAEARRIVPEHHGSVSGALSNLHMVGRIACLAERREQCHPYVMPENVDDRETREQGRDMPNRNRQAGDYLERQTKAALEQHEWFVTRAAGSLGPADLVALRHGSTPLLIACKTNGKMPPTERRALIDASRRAGGRPLLAHRTKRGWIDFVLVGLDGGKTYGPPIKVPKRGAQVNNTDSTDDDEGGEGR